MNDILRAQIETPMSKNDPRGVKLENIPLPPQSMWTELDNSAATTAAPVLAESPAPEVQAQPATYFGKMRERSIPLQYPVAIGGHEITTITIRRLTLGEAQDLLEKSRGRTLMLMEIYAEMTGLSEVELRSLDDEDGTIVIEAAYDFLPPRFKADDALPAN
ncbi:phage tail assembly protein [Rhizobium sp. BK377]|uniref:phage tail assembly protein n=1 Tax=Rhizobium sp. BK377 TaxID=2587058 RepID=UPI0016142806|nr:phage tail assembly protein [Rhizobium sp. BK377]MBB3461969.1 hypothetical protein [Rhizobium sp. BK377]